ncbi:leucine-rich repeat domain-containing protein [Actinomadura logoneensis]|uniref:Leucine-rich repeat domain-containing protein n=1 Tax=Actinomadura logoneensis TaxID=2293572 RepID=A0A372JSG5_9ACTN|nr:STM4015 family protein [Actinomadura logoneensis]RFU42957.1 leucine-rich repeat domain-containing protein [Actinomadura logoneensis]
MTIHEHLTEYAGLPVAGYGPDDDLLAEAVASPSSYAWAVRTSYDEGDFADVFARFREEVDTSQVTALIIGYWGASYDAGSADVGALLAEAAPAFPALRSLFVGDIVMEEAEVSWIEHGDITPVLNAYPDLERLDVRGSQDLVLEPVKHGALRTLRFETGGLPAEIVRAVGASDLPNLTRLDLWLGTQNYGGDATVADLAPVLSGERFPALRRLGLMNSEIQDEVAVAVAGAAVVAQLETLSLGMGVLTDAGAEALLAGQPLTHLKKLDLAHHFLSDAMMERLRTSLEGVEVVLDDQEKPDGDFFFIAVSE